MTSSVHQFKVTDIQGKTVGLDKYKGHVLVIVNVASRWGKTDVNYRQLVELTEKYPELRVLAFPCNQFGGQEPGTNQEIKDFVVNKYNAKVKLHYLICLMIYISDSLIIFSLIYSRKLM